jgi:hypothetical protein
MKSTITITPIDNIKNNMVINNDLVEQKTFDSRNDILTFIDVPTGKVRQGALINVSLYDDLLVLNEIKYNILRMITK